MLSCADQPGYTPIRDGLWILAHAQKAYGHNIIGFDLPALKRVYPQWTYKGQMIDTYTVACMRWAHQKDADFSAAKLGKFPVRLAGSHTLEAWGHRLGNNKGEYKDWCKANCEQDTDVNRDLVIAIKKHGVSPQAVDIELRLAAYLAKQQANGVPFDLHKAADLQATLLARKEELHVRLVQKFGMLTDTWEEKLTPKRDNKTRGYKAGEEFTKVKTQSVQFNPSSNQHIERCLREHYGWQPKAFTKTGVAEITEEVLKTLSGKETLGGIVSRQTSMDEPRQAQCVHWHVSHSWACEAERSYYTPGYTHFAQHGPSATRGKSVR